MDEDKNLPNIYIYRLITKEQFCLLKTIVNILLLVDSSSDQCDNFSTQYCDSVGFFCLNLKFFFFLSDNHYHCKEWGVVDKKRQN